jgi:hypothetical protein
MSRIEVKYVQYNATFRRIACHIKCTVKTDWIFIVNVLAQGSDVNGARLEGAMPRQRDLLYIGNEGLK